MEQRKRRRSPPKPVTTSSRDRGQNILYCRFATLGFRHSTLRQLHKMSFTNLSNGEEVGRDPHSNYHRRSLCPNAAPRLALIQLRNMTYHHKHYVTRRTRLHRKESSNMNLGIQILSNGTRTTGSALGIGQRCTNAGSRSSWECSPSRPV
jgi:hypothetical protein